MFSVFMIILQWILLILGIFIFFYILKEYLKTPKKKLNDKLTMSAISLAFLSLFFMYITIIETNIGNREIVKKTNEYTTNLIRIEQTNKTNELQALILDISYANALLNLIFPDINIYKKGQWFSVKFSTVGYNPYAIVNCIDDAEIRNSVVKIYDLLLKANHYSSLLQTPNLADVSQREMGEKFVINISLCKKEIDIVLPKLEEMVSIK